MCRFLRGMCMKLKARLVTLAKNFAAGMQSKDIAAYAGSCAYFFVISLVPLLILISSTLPYTTLTQQDLAKAITEITPDFADDIVLKLIDETYGESVAVFSISALATIWAGALGMLSVIKGLNCINGVQEKRNYFYLRAIAGLYTLAMIAIMLGILMIMVFEKIVRTIAVSHFPRLLYIVSLSVYFKFLVVLIIGTFLFALIYTFVPGRRMKFIRQLPGAIFSAVAWYFFSWMFSVYVDFSGHFSVYGSIATLLIMMIWLYFCIYIFLIGAYINNFLRKDI